MIVPLALWGMLAQDATLVTFKRTALSDQFFCEGATFGDFNKDGKGDVASGPYWYEGPDFKARHELYPPKAFEDRRKYSDNFFAWTPDLNADGWVDLLVIGFPGKEAFWLENPQGKEGHWPRHPVLDEVSNESPDYVDLTGDGKREIVCTHGGAYGYASPDPADPKRPWIFRAVTEPKHPGPFLHGMGVGDVNGDGRADLLHAGGWYEQPAGEGLWKHHAARFGQGGAQILVTDVDGDGDNDVISSLAAHHYGLSWFENRKEGFLEHRFMDDTAAENAYGAAFSELHALALADVDGDGLLDIVTGKRWWSHGPRNDDTKEFPAVLYWFRLERRATGAGPVEYVPHLIDRDSGVGVQVVAGDINGDGAPDIVVGNKKGTFVHLQERRKGETVRPKPNAGWAARWAPTPGTMPLPNLDFEMGTLDGWTAEGDAFKGQPVRGEIAAIRPQSEFKYAAPQGHYWIGGFEKHQDAPTGTLTSAAFKLTAPFASFRIGGGSGAGTRVEIVEEGGGVLFKVSGRDSELMLPVVADLSAHADKTVRVRLVDNASEGWGHLNFDDFRLHEKKPELSALTKDPRVISQALPQDQVAHAGLSPAEAARAFTAPPGFSVLLGAGEPDVTQPIAMALDHRGRVWVAEAHTYPVRAAEDKGRDRLLIFEDADGDGRLESRKVFVENLNLVSGIEVGFGGVWVGAAPYLLFIPDADGNDAPDGPPQVLLDGWGLQDTHETLNTFVWGPDGWLYGCHGVFTHSLVGKPGAPKEQRQPINAGIWRYHPTRHEFEVFAWGTSNPWGMDFDENGQSFCEACVIPHLYHVIQGARYERQGGQHFDPYFYQDIKTIADHRHYLGPNPHGGNNKSDAAGGGHAHVGAMIYQGDAWPAEYRGRFFTNNIHGARINQEVLTRKGSGYVGGHAPDFLLANDRWSQIMNLRSGPDGQAWMIDWYDAQQCHLTDPKAHDRSNGRIFKVVYGKPAAVKIDMAKLGDAELAGLTLHRNEWHVRHARKRLQERAASGADLTAARTALSGILRTHAEVPRRLRALWALHVSGGVAEPLAMELLGDDSEFVRAWAIQLKLEDRKGSPEFLAKLGAMAAQDPSPVVRLYLASAMQRLPVADRWGIADGLLARGEDADDHNLPLMIWYGIEPAVATDAKRAGALLARSKIPLLQKFIAQRMAVK